MSVTMSSPVKTETVTTEGNLKPIHNKKRRHKNEHLIISVLGTMGLILWLGLFSLGMLIDSGQYRNTLNTDFTWFKFIMTILTFTPTNIAILCLVSSFTGGCASILIIRKAERVLGLTDESKKKTNSHIYMNESPFSSMLRGILVFFAFLAGVFITSSNALSAPTLQVYTQAAGVVSLLAFLVGYDPTMFNTLINLSEKIKGSE